MNGNPEIRATLNRRYDDIESGRVKPISVEEMRKRLREKREACRGKSEPTFRLRRGEFTSIGAMPGLRRFVAHRNPAATNHAYARAGRSTRSAAGYSGPAFTYAFGPSPAPTALRESC